MKPLSPMRSISSSGSDASALFQNAHTEWEAGRDKVAFLLYLEAASLGDPSAQHNVGYFYDVGIGTRKDSRKALFWYKKAWRADKQTGTCINIAQLYVSKRNIRSALHWWHKAIDLGDGDAALDLAKFYLDAKDARARMRALSLLRKVKLSRRVTEAALEEADELLQSELSKGSRGAKGSGAA